MKKYKLKNKINKIIILAIILLLPKTLLGAMQSSSYVIYDSVMHSFDGPVISSVSSNISEITPTITWNTDVVSDGFVIYDTDNSFSNSKEQGTSVKNATSHSVSISGLSANTTYYYKVRSERVNNGITTDNTIRSFITGTVANEVEEEEPSGGGGILIIDKTDKVPPVISNISTELISPISMQINWETDEEATSFVEYGGINYGSVYGHWSSSTEHTVILVNLIPNKIYHFRALSSDDWGNVGYSGDVTFITAEDESQAEPIEEDFKPEEQEDQSIITEAMRKSWKFIKRLFPNLNINDLENINSINELSGAGPILSGDPDIKIGPTEVTIKWTTDIDASSLVAVAPESVYNPNKDEPYQQIIGNSEEKIINHKVTLYNLTPDTVYHFQVRSKSELSEMSKSKDYTFRTSIEELQITSFLSQITDNQTAVFKWVTNKPSNSAVKFAPFHNNVLAIDQSKIIKDNTARLVHEIKVSDFIAGTFYEINMLSIDEKGNTANEILEHFSTTEDDLPPVISHIKTDSTIFVDKSSKIQTIISWITNEPSTSKIYFQEGVHGNSTELTESTSLNNNYTKEHVMVITKFKPGIVYTFRVESVDSGGNSILSKAHTFMTAKKKESIIQVIINILENTFGWIKGIF